MDENKVEAEEKAREQRQAQVGDVEAPVRRIRLRDQPYRKKGESESDHRCGGRRAECEESEGHRDDGSEQRRDGRGDGHLTFGERAI